jgi:hypothetical protein
MIASMKSVTTKHLVSAMPNEPTPIVLEVAPARVVQTDPTQIGQETPRQKRVLWLNPNWRDFHKLWSLRLAGLVMLLSAAEMAVPAFISWIPPRLFALLCFVIVAALGVTRLLNQKSTDL